MNCQDARELIQPYADGEIDLAGTLEVEAHIGTCVECAAAHRNVVALQSSIRAAAGYQRAPASLKRRIRSTLRGRGSTGAPWVRVGIAAAAAVLLISTAMWFATRALRDAPERLLASEVTSAHIRSLMAEHLWDVKSSDQHTVKPWFDGKLDFAPNVQDYTEQSFALEGGRLDYVAGRPVAALVYRHEKHHVNLFVWPAAGKPDRDLVETSQQGFELLHWAQDGMVYWAAADMSSESLRRFVALVRTVRPAATKAAE